MRCACLACAVRTAAAKAGDGSARRVGRAIADCEAIQWVEETIPKVPSKVGLVVNVISCSSLGQ